MVDDVVLTQFLFDFSDAVAAAVLVDVLVGGALRNTPPALPVRVLGVGQGVVVVQLLRVARLAKRSLATARLDMLATRTDTVKLATLAQSPEYDEEETRKKKTK